MSANYFDLDVSFPVLKEGLTISEFSDNRQIYDHKNLLNFEDLVSDEFKNFFADRGLQVFMVEHFHLKPFSVGSTHVDVYRGDATKINWVFGGEDSKMNWYRELPTTTSKDTPSNAGTTAITFKMSELQLIDSYKLRGPTVVQTGIPHNVMSGRQHRYCISVCVTEGNGRPTMQRAREIFSDVIKKK